MKTYRIWCTVNGMMGFREAWLKEKGKIYQTQNAKAAKSKANKLTKDMCRSTTASYTYTAQAIDIESKYIEDDFKNDVMAILADKPTKFETIKNQSKGESKMKKAEKEKMEAAKKAAKAATAAAPKTKKIPMKTVPKSGNARKVWDFVVIESVQNKGITKEELIEKTLKAEIKRSTALAVWKEMIIREVAYVKTDKLFCKKEFLEM